MHFGSKPMPLNRKFTFSQQKIHHYLECQRRFELKYILQQPWPAIRSQPVIEMERQMLEGQQFHLMAQQYLSSIDPVLIETQINSEKLNNWWQSFISFSNSFLTQQKQIETQLVGDIAGFRFIAILDLLVFQPPDHFLILDWKTNTQKPNRSIIEQQIQTRLYPSLLVTAGSSLLPNTSVSPAQVEMTYWFANHPNEYETFIYSKSKYEEDLIFFEHIVKEISQQTDFPKTEKESRCKFCEYRSLCNRGVQAGESIENDEINWQEKIETIDFDQVGEISF
ncbi:MAG: hypothetical protein CVU39_05300 [Chloroflexi bacterium HGW-Chloroflexi-10]|nr:MAG: hypothetical protein CVU39_05300 [Chloroflexi bacterium HGW-Chloroflexi-10]